MLKKITADSTKPTVKAGVSTTEFWLTVAANIFGILNADKVWTMVSPHESAILMSVVTTGYLISRGWAKSK